jgi:hypothetical protein
MVDKMTGWAYFLRDSKEEIDENRDLYYLLQEKNIVKKYG